MNSTRFQIVCFSFVVGLCLFGADAHAQYFRLIAPCSSATPPGPNPSPQPTGVVIEPQAGDITIPSELEQTIGSYVVSDLSAPSGWLYLSGQVGGGGSCTASNSTIGRCLGAQGVTQTASRTFRSPPGAVGAAQFTFTGTVFTSSVPPEAVTRTCVTRVFIGTDLAIEKTVSAPSVPNLGPLSFTLTPRLIEGAETMSVTITDRLPDAVTIEAIDAPGWSCSTQGQQVTCTRPSPLGMLPITIDTRANTPGAYRNCAQISGVNPDPDESNNESCVDFTIDGDPGGDSDLSLILAGPEQAPVSSQITYTATVGNAGPDAAPDPTVTFIAPDETSAEQAQAAGWICTAGPAPVICSKTSAFEAGASGTLSFQVTAPPFSTTIEICGAIDSSSFDPVPSNNEDCVETEILGGPGTSLGLNAAFSPTSINPGEPTTLTYSVGNLGTVDATGIRGFSVSATPGVTVDLQPSGNASRGWSCTQATSGVFSCSRTSTLAASRTTPAARLTYNVSPSFSEPSFTVCVQATSDQNPTGIQQCRTVQVSSEPAEVDMAITGTTDTTTPSPGQTINMNMNVRNFGPAAATGVRVTTSLPSGYEFLSAAQGDSRWVCSSLGGVPRCSARFANFNPGVKVPLNNFRVRAPSVPADGQICHTVRSNEGDSDLSNNEVCFDMTMAPEADVALSKTGPATILAGEQITYQLSVQNLGPSSATGIIVQDPLPDGSRFLSAGGPGWSCQENSGLVTCTRSASLSSGSTAPPISLMAVAPGEPGDIQNCATVSANQVDPDPSNNQGCATTTIQPSSDLSLSKAGTAFSNPGGATRLDLGVTNLGPSSTGPLGVTVSVSLPAGTTYLSATGGWNCSPNGTGVSVTCSRLGNLAAGSSASRLGLLLEAPDVGGATTLTSCSVLTGPHHDPDPSNNTACREVTINPGSPVRPCD